MSRKKNNNSGPRSKIEDQRSAAPEEQSDPVAELAEELGLEEMKEASGVYTTASPPEPALDMFAIVLEQRATLGNGDRIAGSVLGTLTLEPGVTIEEFRNLMLNPHLCGVKRL